MLVPGTISATLTRRVLTAALLVLPVAGLLLAEGQDAGWYGRWTGYALLIAVNIVLLVAVGLITGARAARMEAADAEARLELRQQSQLGEILAHTPCALSVKTFDGRFRLASASYEHMYGLAPGSVVGRRDTDVHPPERLDTILDRERAAAAAEDPVVFEEELPGRRSYVVTMFALRDAGRPYAICSVANEVTALRHAEDRLKALLDASPEAMICVAEDGAIRLANARALALFGYSAELLTGSPVEILVPEAQRHRHAGHRQRYLADPSPRSMGEGMHLTGCRADGSEFPVKISLSAVESDGRTVVFAAIQDITAEVEAERRLRVEREQFRLIMTAASDPFLSIDESGRVTEWNRQAQQLLGWARHQVVDRHLGETALPARYLPALDRLLDERGDRLLDHPTEMFARHSDGREIPVELTLWRIRLGGPSTFHAFARDITARRQIEQDLERARDQAVETARLKSQFLATMSHEIRTPMNGVIGLSQLLGGTPLDEVQRRYTTGIHDAGRALLAVVNDILDFSKLEAGKAMVDRVGFDPGRLLEDVAALVRGTGGPDAPAVRVRCDPLLPRAVRGDQGKLRQVLLNLAGNAVKFTLSGEVTLAAEPDAGADGIRFTVTDTGIGIDEERQRHLFEPFVQGDATTTRRFGGTGLGLAISRELVTLLGGELRLSSRLGEGSTFWFAVPLEPAQCPPPAGPDPVVAPPDGDGGLVLLVEDNEINQIVAAGILAGLGYRTEIAANGREAAEMAATGDYRAILMDCLMPEMDGYQATAAIRRAEDGARHVPIIAMTAGALAEDRERCLAAGMDDHVAKPVMAADLAAALSTRAPADRERAEIEVRLAQLRGISPDLGPPVLAGLLRRLSESAPLLLEDILQALALDDLDTVRQTAHQLKGVAANLGVTALARTCDAVMTAAHADDPDRTVEEVAGLRERLRRVLAAVDEAAAGLTDDATVG